MPLLLARSELSSSLTALEQHPPTLDAEEDAVLGFSIDIEGALGLLSRAGDVSSKSTCAATTTAEGTGLTQAQVGQPAFFTITARDRRGELRGVGGDTFQVQLTAYDKKDEEQVPVHVEDKGDGTHVAYFTMPAAAGGEQAGLAVRVRGAHISGSPFSVQLRRELAGTFVRTWGSRGSGNGQFSNPWGVAVSAAGEVFVTDQSNNRVQVFK